MTVKNAININKTQTCHVKLANNGMKKSLRKIHISTIRSNVPLNLS